MLSVKRVWWASSLSFAMSMMMILKLIRTGNIVHNQFAAATYTSYIYKYMASKMHSRIPEHFCIILCVHIQIVNIKAICYLSSIKVCTSLHA